MPTAPKYRWIPAAAAKKHHCYNGYKEKDSRAMHFCDITYIGDGEGYLWGEPTQHVSNITELQEEITWMERSQWYKDYVDLSISRNSNNLIGIHTDLYSIGDAYHEMWNGWVEACDPWKMIAELEEETFYLVGIAPAPWDKDDIFGKGNSVAFVACYYDSDERFWCHGSKNWVQTLRDFSMKEYEALNI